MTTQHAAIFLGGDPPRHLSWIRHHLNHDSLVIAADSGWSHAVACGLTPHVLIGDMDSITSTDLERARLSTADIVAFDHDKDFTDAELALSHAMSRDVRRITVVSGGGDRFDHLLGVVHSLIPVAEAGIEVTMLCDDTTVQMLVGSKERTLITSTGETISLVPLGGDAVGVTTTGLQWNLADDVLSVRASRGVSNRATSTSVTIALAAGTLAIMRPAHKEPTQKEPTQKEPIEGERP